MAYYWCNNVTGDDTTGDGSELTPWKTIAHSVNQLAILPTVGHTLRVVNTGTTYPGALCSIGAHFIGMDWDNPGLTIEGYPNNDWPTIRIPGVIGSPNQFDIQADADYVIIRFFNFVTDGVGPFGYSFHVEWRAEHVRLECMSWGASIAGYGSTIAINVGGTGDRTLDLEVRCCYWKTSVGGGGWKRFILWPDGTSARLSVHHCVLEGGDVGMHFSGGTYGTIEVYNCSFVDIVRCIQTGTWNSTGSIHVYNCVFVNISLYVWYCANSITPGVISHHNNCYFDVADYCDHPTCNRCQITVPGLTDLEVDPDFVGTPDWEWIYGCLLTANYQPQNNEVLSGSDANLCMGACLPFEEEPCICAKPVPAPPCDPWDVLTCNYNTFVGEYPADWVAAFANPHVPPILLVVCYDPGGENLQLTPFVKGGRPIAQGRDIIFGAYKGRDTDIEFVDPTGRFDPRDANSILYEKAWYGKFVDVGAWIQGTTSVLKLQRYFLADAKPTGKGTTVWRLKDIFAWLIRGETRANALGNFVVSNGGTIDSTKASCDQTVCRQQIWTVTFTTGTDFQIEGSLMGLDGAGSTAGDFISTSGFISILSTFWVAGPWAIGDTVTFNSGVRYTARNVIQAARDMLVNLSDIPERWLNLTSWNNLEAKSAAYKITYWSHDVDDPLRLLRLFMRHRFATAYPTEEGEIAVMTFEPDPAQGVLRCIGKRLTLMQLEPEHLKILNVLSAVTGHGDEVHPTTGATYPADGMPNPSVARYDTSFPYKFTLRGYVSADYTVVYGLLQLLYVSRAGMPYYPRQLFRGRVKIQELNMTIGEVVYIDSVVPERLSYGLIVNYEKDVFKRTLTVQLLDVTDFIEPPAGCGYAYCGGEGTTDDCWVYG